MNKLFYILFILLSITACDKKSENSKTSTDGTSNSETQAKEEVHFLSDGLDITADYYPNEKGSKMIVMFHKAGSSRGEYNLIAPEMVKKGYSCLAVDLRFGKEIDATPNKTAAAYDLANGKDRKSDRYMDAMADVLASVDYAAKKWEKPIIVWGSSYSAGLCMMAALNDERITRVVAFSPVECFDTQDDAKNAARSLKVPVFVTGGLSEWEVSVKPILQVIDPQLAVSYEPKKSNIHGSDALWPTSPDNKEIRKALDAFL